MLPEKTSEWPSNKVEAYKYTDLSKLGALGLPDGQILLNASHAFTGDELQLSGTESVTLDSLIPAARSAGSFIIRLARNSSITLTETITSQQAGVALGQQDMLIILEDNAQLTHVRCQQLDVSAFHLGETVVSLGRDSRYKQVALTTGGALTRHELKINLGAVGASAELYALQLLGGGQHGDLTTSFLHNEAHTSSVQLVKNVLTGQARGVYQGGIRVAPGAQKTNGQQQSRALLLSPAAEMDTKPELEIFADDVTCSHGAAVGALDDTALFYLRARGLNEAAARALLIDGFIAEVLDYAPEAQHALLENIARDWLEALA